MYYVLMYSFLVFGSRFILEFSQGFLINMSIVGASLLIFYLMFKKYSISLNSLGGFKGYYQSLRKDSENSNNLKKDLLNFNFNKITLSLLKVVPPTLKVKVQSGLES